MRKKLPKWLILGKLKNNEQYDVSVYRDEYIRCC